MRLHGHLLWEGLAPAGLWWRRAAFSCRLLPLVFALAKNQNGVKSGAAFLRLHRERQSPRTTQAEARSEAEMEMLFDRVWHKALAGLCLLREKQRGSEAANDLGAIPSPYHWSYVPRALEVNGAPFLLPEWRTWCVGAECYTRALSVKEPSHWTEAHAEWVFYVLWRTDWYMLLHGTLYIKFHLSLQCGPWFVPTKLRVQWASGEKSSPFPLWEMESEAPASPWVLLLPTREATRALITFPLSPLHICSPVPREKERKHPPWKTRAAQQTFLYFP